MAASGMPGPPIYLQPSITNIWGAPEESRKRRGMSVVARIHWMDHRDHA